MQIHYRAIETLALSKELRDRGYERPSVADIEMFKRFGPTEPVLVRPSTSAACQYEILGNEKLWFVAQQIHIHEVPTLEVVDETPRSGNFGGFSTGKKDDPISEAERYQDWLDEHPKFGKAALARLEGCTRTTISHRIRLLGLEPEIQALIRQNRLSASHGLVLLTLAPGQGRVALAVRCAQENWSVACLRSNAKNYFNGQNFSKSARTTKDPDVLRLEQALTEQIGSNVDINARRGTLTIDYCGDLDVLSGIIELVLKRS